MQDIPAVSEIVRRLPTISRPELVKIWEQYHGQPPAKRLAPELMRPVLAFKIQERAYGGQTPDILRQLREIAKFLRPESRAQDEANNRYKAGTRIIREWGGKTYEVVITAVGYEFEGDVYKSLSPIARRITGTRWSGPAFFGTKRQGGAR